MTRKKKKKEDEKPWCYYCDRIFSDENTLIQHQKNKHFKCAECNRKLNTAQGLAVHSYQVHKVTVDSVPGAKPGRENVEIEIFGMAGVPEGLKPGLVQEEEPAAKKAKVESPSPYTPVAPVGLPPQIPPRPLYPPPIASTSLPPNAGPHMAAGPSQPPHPGHHLYPPTAPQQQMGYGYPGYGMPAGAPSPYLPQPRLMQGPMPGAVPPIQGLPPMGMPSAGPPHMGLPPQGPPAGPLFPIHHQPPPGAPMSTPVPPPYAPQVPLSGPLFPINGPPPGSGPYSNGPPLARPPLTSSPLPGQPYPGTAILPPAGLDLDALVWKDDLYSMEERRAMLPKYAEKSTANGGVTAGGPAES